MKVTKPRARDLKRVTCWKVESEARMDPPIQTEYFLSGGAMILIFIVAGAKAVISFCIRSAIPRGMMNVLKSQNYDWCNVNYSKVIEGWK